MGVADSMDIAFCDATKVDAHALLKKTYSPRRGVEFDQSKVDEPALSLNRCVIRTLAIAKIVMLPNALVGDVECTERQD